MSDERAAHFPEHIICPDCGEPFGIGNGRHACTMGDDKLRQFVLDWCGRGWQGVAIRNAPSTEAAAERARDILGAAGFCGPHYPTIDGTPAGVVYSRDPPGEPGTRRYRLTWRQVAEALRAPATQLPLFALAG